MKHVFIKPDIPPPASNFSAKAMCKTCAYRWECTPEEDEMTLAYYAEHPLPHPCHERREGVACVGSMEALERLTDWRRA